MPASPYANTEGAISAISLARTEEIPFLGTCGGFQHALIEYFRNVLGATDAAHAELNPEAEHPVISRLSCSLVEVTGTIRLTPGSLAERLYGTDRVEEGYRCSYGLNPYFAQSIRGRDGLHVEGTDDCRRNQDHSPAAASVFPDDAFPTGALLDEGPGASAHPRVRLIV